MRSRSWVYSIWLYGYTDLKCILFNVLLNMRVFSFFFCNRLVIAVGKVAWKCRAPAGSTNQTAKGSPCDTWQVRLAAKKKKTAIKVLTTSHEASCCKHGVTAEGDLDECICICIKSECYFHFDYDSGAVEDAAKRGRSDFPRIFVIGRSVLFFWWECKQANAQKQSNVGSFFGSPLFFCVSSVGGKTTVCSHFVPRLFCQLLKRHLRLCFVMWQTRW